MAQRGVRLSYRCIVADPPWCNSRGGNTSRSPARHYPVMKVSQIADVMRASDVWKPADSCHLWLWATNYQLPEAFELMGLLGFRYATNFAWFKNDGRLGIGIYLRGCHELCLLGVRGPAMIPQDRSIPSYIEWPRMRHSKKPQAAYDLIQRVSPGPYAEIFARGYRPGWDVWGSNIEELIA